MINKKKHVFSSVHKALLFKDIKIKYMNSSHFIILVVLVLFLQSCGRPISNSLRILTYNVQFKVAPARESECCGYIPERANKIAHQLKLGDYDIIALQEVFDEEAKNIFVDSLKNKYPYFVKYIDESTPFFHDSAHLGIDFHSNSGLMLFSRFKFLNIPEAIRAGDAIAFSDGVRNPNVGFIYYDATDNNLADDWANKGAGFVKIQNTESNRIYNVFFTHTDSGNDSGDKDSRDHEIGLINGAIRNFGGGNENVEDIFFIGDFNIDGNILLDDRSEWESHFSLTPVKPMVPSGLTCIDEWNFGFQPNDIGRELKDNGLCSDLQVPDQQRHRTDYVFHSDPPLANTHLVTQFMALGYNLFWGNNNYNFTFGKGGDTILSDHAAVICDLNLPAPQCNPATAGLIERDMMDQTLSGTLTWPGSMQFWRINDPGSYAIEVTPGLKYQVFTSDNYSIPLNSYHNEIVHFNSIADNTVHQGTKFIATHGPLFIRVFKDSRLRPSSYNICIHECKGKNKEEAIPLYANFSQKCVAADFVIGISENIWFELDTETPTSGRAQKIKFFVQNIEQTDAFNLRLLDADEHLITENIDDIENNPDIENLNGKRFYLIIQPLTSPGPTRYFVGWKTNLNVLHPMPHHSLSIRCEETVDEPYVPFGVSFDDNVFASSSLSGLPPSSPIALGTFHEGESIPINDQLGIIRFLDDENFGIALIQRGTGTGTTDALSGGFITHLNPEESIDPRLEINHLQSILTLREDHCSTDCGRYSFLYFLSHGLQW